ncbi:hypothetical protein H4R20_001403 [Coemansia guatemalensis]|uniref:Uncharacterized protein n=1 Tax=Coemansia guatemalensis TaxID=2761395 RepID=A0A9W8LUJ9_9FUNG|nr:hypothetical protein H4R20_001403 [Coemansia guatemalensis]
MVQCAHSERAAEKEPSSVNSGTGGKILLSMGEHMASICRRSVGAGLRASVDRGEMTMEIAQQLQAVIDTGESDQLQHLRDSTDMRECMEQLDQRFVDLNRDNQSLHKDMRNLSTAIAALTMTVQVLKARPASPNPSVVCQEQNRASLAVWAFPSTLDGPATMDYTRPQVIGYKEFMTPMLSSRPAGPVSRYRGAITGGEDHPHRPMRTPAMRGAMHMPYPE